jgi:ornithine cyclodeaminase
MQEVDCETILKSKVIVDDLNSCLEEAGDLLVPLNQKLIKKDHILCDLSELIFKCSKNENFIRKNKDDITLFKSVGISLQDISIGHYVYKKSKKLNLGKDVNYL